MPVRGRQVMVRFNKQLRKCRKAVSEIIGNLLILGITVTLFSSIMFYVVSMPQPQEQTYAEMSYQLSDLSDGGRWINVTHKGGQVLNNWSTNIYLNTGSNYIPLKISNSTTSLGDDWVTGETWSYRLTGIDQNTPIEMMVIDSAHNVIVWRALMTGGQTLDS
jgi:FlaG/FlaF family flagellin (archaellin)